MVENSTTKFNVIETGFLKSATLRVDFSLAREICAAD